MFDGINTIFKISFKGKRDYVLKQFEIDFNVMDCNLTKNSDLYKKYIS